MPIKSLISFQLSRPANDVLVSLIVSTHAETTFNRRSRCRITLSLDLLPPLSFPPESMVYPGLNAPLDRVETAGASSIERLLRNRGVRPANRHLKIGAPRAASNLLLVENRNVVRRTTLGGL